MFISASKKGGKGAAIYLFVSLFCLIFYLVYDIFSHGVHSPYMTFLFAWPLVLGLLPCVAFWLTERLKKPKRIAKNLYNSGVAALTASSMLRGIFDIAGTSSDYQQWLMYAGAVMLAAGICMYFAGR